MPMEPISVILSVIAALLYVTIYIKRYSEVIPYTKYYKLGVFLFYISILIPLFNIKDDSDFYLSRALLVIFLYMLSIFLIFKSSLLSKVFLLLNFIIYTLTSFLFVSSLFATNLEIPISLNGINLPLYYNLSYFFSYLICLIQLIVLEKIVTKDRLKNFFLQKRNLITVISIQSIFFTNIFAIGSTNLSDDFNLFYNNLVLIISFTNSVAYFIIVYSISSISFLSTYKFVNATLKNQLESQVAHYRNYETYVISFAKFKHDFDKVVETISNSDLPYDKVIEILKESDDELEKIASNYTRYSNNYILDALLNDFSSKFSSIHASKNIEYVHFNSQINDLDLIKLFYNIMQNAYEALELVPLGKEKSININSTFIDDFQVIQISNTMNESTQIENKYRFTIKPNKVLHGFGTSSINEIIEKYGGLITREKIKDNSKTTYQVKIFLPLEINK